RALLPARALQLRPHPCAFVFVFNDTAPPETYTLSLHDALPISAPDNAWTIARRPKPVVLSGVNYSVGKVFEALPLYDLWPFRYRSEEHTSELQSREHRVCRLLLEKKKTKQRPDRHTN